MGGHPIHRWTHSLADTGGEHVPDADEVVLGYRRAQHPVEPQTDERHEYQDQCRQVVEYHGEAEWDEHPEDGEDGGGEDAALLTLVVLVQPVTLRPAALGEFFDVLGDLGECLLHLCGGAQAVVVDVLGGVVDHLALTYRVLLVGERAVTQLDLPAKAVQVLCCAFAADGLGGFAQDARLRIHDAQIGLLAPQS